jgi:hypothetical protein
MVDINYVFGILYIIFDPQNAKLIIYPGILIKVNTILTQFLVLFSMLCGHNEFRRVKKEVTTVELGD